ncbi:hypothetical protein [Phormidesmis priestleyi]|uniref:hypothetical protein n=1 Tax=Phormidesmis priestleyi TaxID=268141 RepID=UPI000B31555D|nr:hypothetical protein [Phormidesmis priestleyi]
MSTKNSGSGTIVRPDSDQILLLSQRPYRVLGTLREQILYSNTTIEVEKAQLDQVLEW